MSVGQYVRGLNAYDLLGNLIPGTIGLIVIMGFLSSPPIPTDIGEYGLFIAITFIVGAIGQGHASKAAGPRKEFEKTMDSAEDLSSLQYQDDDSENGGDDNDIQGNSEVGGNSDNEESAWWSGRRKKETLAAFSPVSYPIAAVSWVSN